MSQGSRRENPFTKRFPEAEGKFEQAVKDNPRFAEAHNNLGYTLKKQGAANYQKSLEHYNTAVPIWLFRCCPAGIIVDLNRYVPGGG
jgi:hypothetical protein